MVWMENVATEGVDGRFAEDEVGAWSGRKGEEAKIFTGARSHAAPGHGTGAAQFGTDGLARGVAQKEDGVGSGIGIEVAGAGIIPGGGMVTSLSAMDVMGRHPRLLGFRRGQKGGRSSALAAAAAVVMTSYYCNAPRLGVATGI